MADKPTLPAALPGGTLVPHLSARRRHEIADIVFEMCGGVERLAHEADKNSESYWTFIEKVWAKGLPRAVATEHSASEGVEALLEKLDRADKGTLIGADALDITPLDSDVS